MGQNEALRSSIASSQGQGEFEKYITYMEGTFTRYQRFSTCHTKISGPHNFLENIMHWYITLHRTCQAPLILADLNQRFELMSSSK